MRSPRRPEATSLVDPNGWLIFLVTLGVAAFLSIALDIEFKYLRILIVTEIVILGIVLPLRRARRLRAAHERERRMRFERYREELGARQAPDQPDTKSPAD